MPLMLAIKRMVLISVGTCSVVCSNAQYTDTTVIKNSNDGIKITSSSLQHVKLEKPIKLRSFFVPAFMVAYGATTLKSNRMKDINMKVKEEFTEKQHDPMHIDNYLLIAPAVAVYGLNLAGIKGKNNFRDRSILLMMSSVITNGIVFSVKNISHEKRPDGSDDYSFPSGHTAQAFASAEFLRQEYKDVSPWYGVAGYVTASATGMLRMYNNKHWLSDVVAGAGVGIASTKLAYWIYPKIKKMFFKNRSMNTMVMPFYQSGTAGVSMVYNFH